MKTLRRLSAWPILLSLGLCCFGEVEYNRKVERTIISGDMIQLTVEEQTALNGTYGVGGDGTISLGELGRVEVAERSMQDAEFSIKTYLESKYFRQATVRVSIAEYVEGEVILMGALGGSGDRFGGGDEGILAAGSIHRFQVSEGQLLSIFDAVLQAGGLSPSANGKEVMVMRWKPGFGLEREIFTVDVDSIFRDLRWENDQFLRPRDIVYVPFLKSGDAGNMEILVLGATGSNGYRRWYRDMDVLRLAASSFGSIGAEGNNARILRPDGAGGYAIIPVDLGRLFGNADMNQNHKLLPGDIFYVPPAGIATAGEAWLMGAVARPGPVVIPPKGETTLARLLYARGPTKYAKLRSVQVSRKAPDGETQVITIDVKRILDTANFEEDFPIQDGDIIKVDESFITIP